jgi:hypothetical protein
MNRGTEIRSHTSLVSALELMEVLSPKFKLEEEIS